MKIEHQPYYNPDQVIDHFSKKDGVEITYVCTTDLKASDVPVDVFYRETPHPEFGNRYFGLYHDNYRDSTMICNAEMVEELIFGMVKDDNGNLQYSQSHHDYKTFENGNMIDGGRVYIKTSKGADVYKIKNGKFFEITGEELTDWLNENGIKQHE